MDRPFSLGAATWRRSAAEAGEDFLSRHLPLFFAWFACGVVVFLVAFVVYMTFNTGLPTEPNLTLRNYTDAFDSHLPVDSISHKIWE